jgi:ParB family chromosome partitioning protein
VSRLRGAFEIDISLIRPDPNQPRRELGEEELGHLAASIAERGILQPVRVWHNEPKGQFQIISGERRYRGALAAGLKVLPCIVEDGPVTGPPRRKLLVDQVVENWQRQDLNPYDLSDALKELRDEQGISQQEIAKLTGKPASEISRYLAMQRIAPAVQQEIRSDDAQRFSRRHVVAIAKLSPEEQASVSVLVKTESLTAEQTEREVAKRLKRRTGQAVRGSFGSVRRYAVGSTRVSVRFRKDGASAADVLHVLDRVRAMVEREDGTEAN